MHDFAKAHFVHIICLTMQQKSLEKLVAVDHAMLYCTSTKYILLPKDELLLVPIWCITLVASKHLSTCAISLFHTVPFKWPFFIGRDQKLQLHRDQ